MSAAAEMKTTATEVPDCGTHSEGIPHLLPAETIRDLSRLSSGRAAAQVLLEYGAVALTVVLCERFWHPALYVFAVAFLGARYLALGILMHDAAHYRLFPSRALNDWVGSYLLGTPIMLSMLDYRKVHLAHHRTVASEDDPELPFRRMVASRSGVITLIVGSLLGISAIMLFTGINRGVRRVLPFALIPGFIALAWLAPLAARILFLYWIVPFVTWTACVNVLRTFAEHTTVPGKERLTGAERVFTARVILQSFLGRIFTAPNNVNYHLDHHLYPSVPFYRLPELHALLMQQPGYRERAREHHGYGDVIRDHKARVGEATPL